MESGKVEELRSYLNFGLPSPEDGAEDEMD